MKRLCLILFVLLIAGLSANAQTTEFTYQGRLIVGSLPADSAHDFEFRLYSAEEGGTPLGTLSRPGVQVSNGVFSVRLDFGAVPNSFDGAGRWLEIAVKPAGGASFVTLTPRQPVTSAPYNIKSLSAQSAVVSSNSLQLGGVAANKFVVTTDSRMTDARPPVAGSADYIQNRTSLTPQPSTSFNIDGNGTVGGLLIYPTSGNGSLTIRNRTNSNFSQTVFSDDTNTYRGYIGYIGINSGLATRRLDTVEFGTNGKDLTFRPNETEVMRLTRAGSVGVGTTPPVFKLHVIDESGFGLSVETALSGGQVASFGGNGRFAINSQGGEYERFRVEEDGKVGIGIRGYPAPTFKLQVVDTSNAGLRVETGTAGGTVASFGENGAFEIDEPGFAGGRFRVAENGDVSVGRPFVGGNLTVYGNTVLNTVTIANPVTLNVLGSAGSESICRNASSQISRCSSSIKYKQNINPFNSGIGLINRLRPVSFNWRANNQADMGLVAEDVAKIEPLLATYNDKGEVEGVKYDRIGVVAINAIKEQQAQIEALQKEVALLKELLLKRDGKSRTRR